MLNDIIVYSKWLLMIYASASLSSSLKPDLLDDASRRGVADSRLTTFLPPTLFVSLSKEIDPGSRTTTTLRAFHRIIPTPRIFQTMPSANSTHKSLKYVLSGSKTAKMRFVAVKTSRPDVEFTQTADDNGFKQGSHASLIKLSRTVDRI